MTETTDKTALPIDNAGAEELSADRYQQNSSPKRFVDQVLADPSSRERYEQVLEEIRAHQVTLTEVRRAKSLTQSTIAELLEMDQSEVSRLEKRSDMLLSTLRKFITAAGGELQLIATFPDHQPVNLTIGPAPAPIEELTLTTSD